jgi:cytochrome b561
MSPEGHSVFHWIIALIFLIVGLLYSFVRFVKRIKDFELPGMRDN